MNISNSKLHELWYKFKYVLSLTLVVSMVFNLTVMASVRMYYTDIQRNVDISQLVLSEDEDDDLLPWSYYDYGDGNLATDSDSGLATDSDSGLATPPNAVLREEPGTISGYVWADVNEDGIKDTEESTVADIRVFLFAGADKTQVIEETQTGTSGIYRFRNLIPGEYYVAVGTQTVGTAEYLIPMAAMQMGTDNQFDVDWDNEPVLSYTKLIRIHNDYGVGGVNAGMRVGLPAVPAAGIYNVQRDTRPSSAAEPVGTFDTLQAAVDACDSAGYDYTITLTAQTDSLEAAVTIPEDRVIILTSIQGSRNTIQQTGGARHFIVSPDSSLTLRHIVLEGTGQTSENDLPDNNGGIHVNPGGTVILGAGSVIEKCYAKGGDGGGGIHVDGGTLHLDGATVTDNQTRSWGAGILVKNSGSVTLDNSSKVTNNKAFWDGGGIRVESKAVLTVNDSSEISENIALHGGGICAQGETKVILNDGKITSNTLTGGSGEGGGIRGDNARIEIYGDSEISYNEGYHGGGIFMRNGGKLILEQGVISYNTAGDNGGGVKCESTEVEIGDHAQISHNEGVNGGGIFAQYNASITIGEASVTENAASGNGGGIYADGGQLRINSGGKITANSAAEDGGGIRGTGAVTITLNAGEISDNQGKVGAGISANYGSAVTMNSGSSITGNGSSHDDDGNIKTVRGGGVTMDGAAFTMNGGTISGNTGEYGGGVCLDKSVMNIYGGEISSNEAYYSGGGIYLYNNGSEVNAENCRIISNKVTDGDGGGIYASDWPVTLDNVDISYNTAFDNGGGIFARNCTVVLKETTVRYNETGNSDGGGIRGTNVILTIEKSDISYNQGPNGAGMSINESSDVTMDGFSIVSHNTGSSRGGGVNIDSGTTFTLNGGTISDNKAEIGGGIISNGSKFIMENGRISGNISDTDGGGILAENNSTVELKAVVIESNKAHTDGGGLRLRSSKLSVNSSTINKNEAPNGGGISANGGSMIEMSGGTINQNSTATGQRGGGVNLDQFTLFIMNSGEISYNYAQSGGGVIASAGSGFIMNGGEIAGNVSAYSGGGMRMENSGLSISAGKIDSNKAGYHGGGVYLTSSATLEMTGGFITNNVTSADGGGIYTENLSYLVTADLNKYSNLKISGAVVSGNQSSSPQTPPVNALLFTDFDGMLLTNDQINYYPSGISITYVSNGGGGGTVIEIRGVDANLPLQTVVDLEFTPPYSDYEFIYWSNEPGGTNAGGTRYKGDGITPVIIGNDITFYAIWGPLAGTISGSVFLDSNSSGSYDSSELLEGITVTLYMTDENGSVIDTGQTVTTDAEGRYEFRAEAGQNYKVFLNTVDSDSGGNVVGSAGFIAKGAGDENSHVNQDGFSDVIKLETARQAVIKNAGYAPPFIVISGVSAESAPWVLLVLFSGCIMIGVLGMNRRRRRQLLS